MALIPSELVPLVPLSTGNARQIDASPPMSVKPPGL